MSVIYEQKKKDDQVKSENENYNFYHCLKQQVRAIEATGEGWREGEREKGRGERK
jgi:hypothetical protein